MVQPIKTIVKIGNREYTMRGLESEEYIHKVAIYVNRKMEEIEKAQPSLSTTQIAVLTAINLGDEVVKLKEAVETLQAENSKLRGGYKKNPSPAIYDVSRTGKR